MSRHKKHPAFYRGHYFWLKIAASFLLFLMLSALCLLVCARAFILNPQTAARYLCSDTYITGVTQDVAEYAGDLCLRNGLTGLDATGLVPRSFVEKAESAYVSYAFDAGDNIDRKAYGRLPDELHASLTSALNTYLQQNGYDVQSSAIADGVGQFAEEVCDYTFSRIAVPFEDTLADLFDTGGVLIVAGIVYCSVVGLLAGALIFALKGRFYRNVRYVSYATFASSLFFFAAYAASRIFCAVKTLVIYPGYLCDIVMQYAGACINLLLCGGAVFLVLSAVLWLCVWKLKRIS